MMVEDWRKTLLKLHISPKNIHYYSIHTQVRSSKLTLINITSGVNKVRNAACGSPRLWKDVGPK